MTSTPQRTSRSLAALRLVLVLLGAMSAFVAVNVAFGGLETLGLQGPTDYFAVTDTEAFLLRDSHAHYYGGVYLALGIFLVVAATDLRRHRQALNVAFVMMFVGGLARLTQGDLGVTFGGTLAVSSIIELVGMPLLALWLARATRIRVVSTPLPVAPSRERAA